MEEEEDTGQGSAEELPEVPLPRPGEVEVEAGEDDGFSFPAPPFAADACIVPVYPIFGRPPSPPAPAGKVEPGTATVRVPLGRLLLEEREFRARRQDGGGRSESARAWREHDDEDDDGEGDGDGAAAEEELEGVPPESYCLWAPGGGQASASAPASPRRCRKSGSTGSVLRWRRISDRLVGRSHSDGKEKFVFLTAAAGPEPPPPPPSSKEEKEEGGGAAHQLRYYGRESLRQRGRRRQQRQPEALVSAVQARACRSVRQRQRAAPKLPPVLIKVKPFRTTDFALACFLCILALLLLQFTQRK